MNLIPVETFFIPVFFIQATPTSWLLVDTRYVCTYSYEFTTIFFRFIPELVFTNCLYRDSFLKITVINDVNECLSYMS